MACWSRSRRAETHEQTPSNRLSLGGGAGRNPGLACERYELAVPGEERRAGEELPPFLLERPRGDDTRLARVRHPQDASGHAAQDDFSTAVGSDGVCARAVDRSPDDRRGGLGRRPRCCMERLAADDRSDPDSESVALRAVATDKALAKVGAAAPHMTLPSSFRLLERDRRRRIDSNTRSAGLCDHRGAVEQANSIIHAPHLERTLERWRYAEGHLNGCLGHMSRESTADIAPVCRVQRPSIPARQGDLHRRETTG